MSTVLAIMGKTTYIPSYASYIHIVDHNDTLQVSNVERQLELADKGGMFRISIIHEDLSHERIKMIKRTKALSGWAAASSVLSGVSAALSRNNLQYFVRMQSSRIAGEISAMYAGIAMAEQTLDIEIWVENTSEQELMINDMERGLTWYILPHQGIQLSTNNPDLLRLRVSDLHHQHVSYATVTAGSAVDKAELKYEDDENWFIVAYKREADGTLTRLGGFEQISKKDYSRRLLNYRQIQEYQREHSVQNAYRRP